MSAPGRQPVVLSVNQDAGISPDRAKGAAVHLLAMRQAFAKLGVDCRAIDEPDETRLNESLMAALDEGPVDLIYERYALGKSAASRFASAHNIPVVLEVNAPLADEQNRWRGGSDEDEDTRQDAFTMGMACRIIAVSSEVARYSRERGAGHERVKVFPNAIDVNRFKFSVRDVSVRDDLVPRGRFVIGFHGRLRPWHGFEMLLNVFRRLLARGLDVHLLIVGEGDFTALASLPEDRYTRVWWQAHEDIPRHIAAFDVLPLTYGADLPCYFSPLKLMEAMGCGVVPLVPDLGDLPVAVKHDETGLVYAAGDEQLLQIQLESLIHDRQKLETLGRQAAQEAARHSWTQIAQYALESSRQGALHSALTDLRTQRLTPDQVRRVAVGRTGDLQLEIHEAGKHRFFVYGSNRLYEIHAWNDPRIPFLSKLDELDLTAHHDIISYRPGRRIVIEPESDGQHSMIKAYKKNNVAVAAEKYAIALSACEPGGFDVPTLLHVDLDKDYMLMAKQAGQSPAISSGTVNTWAVIGSCLRHFQEAGATGKLQEFTCAEELAVLDERARRFALCMPGLPENWTQCREQLGQLAATLPAPIRGLAHRDLHDRQFIVAGNTISLLDFDLISIADVALDAANLLVHMKLRTLQGVGAAGDSVLQECREAFIRGLGRQDETGFKQRLLFYQASTFLRLALLYALRPRWWHLTASLIEEGLDCIHSLERLQAGT